MLDMWNILHYTNIKLIMFKKIISSFLSILILLTYSCNNTWAEDIDLQLEIQAGWVTIWSPAIVEFQDIPWSVEDETRDLTLTWAANAFWIEDLKSSSSWYSVDLQMWNFYKSSDPTVLFYWGALEVKINTWLYLFSWTHTWVVLESNVTSWFVSIGTAQTMLSRTVDISWQVGKFWFFPSFRIIVPGWQALWDYEGTLTYTLTQY